MIRALFTGLFSGIIVICMCSACGVRGRPLPPDEPPEIGHGYPMFRRASEGLAVPAVPAVPAAESEESAQPEQGKGQ